MAHAVVKIGGCNGSGKTSVVRALLESNGNEPQYDLKPNKPSAYIRKLATGQKLVILGSYENVCGGMDTISDKYDRLNLVRKYARHGNIVVYEGLITGKTYGAMGEMSEEPNQRGRWLYTFMDTPWEVCVARVHARRIAKGNLSPLDPERTLRPTFGSCDRLPGRVAKLGHRVLMLDHRKTAAQLSTILLDQAQALYDERA